MVQNIFGPKNDLQINFWSKNCKVKKMWPKNIWMKIFFDQDDEDAEAAEGQDVEGVVLQSRKGKWRCVERWLKLVPAS